MIVNRSQSSSEGSERSSKFERTQLHLHIVSRKVVRGATTAEAAKAADRVGRDARDRSGEDPELGDVIRAMERGSYTSMPQ